jgi:hypothetical protein
MAAPRAFPPVAPGTIVWCRFPLVRALAPGPKPRPAFVLAAGEIDGAPGVEVAYGTSQKVDRVFPSEFAITPADAEAFRLSGLSYPTKFDLGCRVELPFNDRWFAVAPGAPFGQTPQMGILHPGRMRRAQAAFRAGRSR